MESGSFILLNDKQYQHFISHKQSSDLAIPSNFTPNHNTINHIQNAQTADVMLQYETHSQQQRVLKTLGLQEIDQGKGVKLVPVNLKKSKFKNFKECEKVVNRLHEKSKLKYYIYRIQHARSASLPYECMGNQINYQIEHKESYVNKRERRKESEELNLFKNMIFQPSEADQLKNSERRQSQVSHNYTDTLDQKIFKKSAYKLPLTHRSDSIHSKSKLNSTILSKDLLDVNTTPHCYFTERSTNPSEAPTPIPSEKSPPTSQTRSNSISTSSNQQNPRNSSSKSRSKSDYLQLINLLKHPKNSKHQELNKKLLKLIQQNPAEIYRIIKKPGYIKKKLISQGLDQDTDWTDEDETAFRSLLLKTYSFNSIAKTRIFKQIVKRLPPQKSAQDTEWKYDKHSPWLNDLAYNPLPSCKRSVSNFIRSKPSPEPTVHQKLLNEKKELQVKTGEFNQDNLYILHKLSDHIDKLHTVRDSELGYNLMKSWHTSKKHLEDAKSKLANYIVKECTIEKKNINKSRYVYLSAKVAHQRASKELNQDLAQLAERKRVQLRERQKKLQRDAGIMNILVKKLYGEKFLHKQKRLETTAHSIGTPLFRHYMKRLGFLEEKEPVPDKSSRERRVVRNLQIEKLKKESMKNLSRLNFKGVKRRLKSKERCLDAEEKMKSYLRGYIVRTLLRWKTKAVLAIQRAFRNYSAKKLLLQSLIHFQSLQGLSSFPYLSKRFANSFLYLKYLKQYNLKPESLHLSPALYPASTLLSNTKSYSYSSSSFINSQLPLHKINTLKYEILKALIETWKLYIISKTHFLPSDEELVSFLKLYSETANKQSILSDINIDLYSPLTPPDLLDLPVSQIIAKLESVKYSIHKQRNTLWHEQLKYNEMMDGWSVDESSIRFYCEKRVNIDVLPVCKVEVNR